MPPSLHSLRSSMAMESDVIVLLIEELALASVKQRDRAPGPRQGTSRVPRVLTHEEVMALVDGRQLSRRGPGAVDVHLLGGCHAGQRSTVVDA